MERSLGSQAEQNHLSATGAWMALSVMLTTRVVVEVRETARLMSINARSAGPDWRVCLAAGDAVDQMDVAA